VSARADHRRSNHLVGAFEYADDQDAAVAIAGTK
jgi:hypothetical protein